MGNNTEKRVRTYLKEDFLASVLRPPAGTDINRDIRAARKYVGPESNLGTIKIVSRRGNLLDLKEIT
jgi:hypothetical protein